MGHPVHDGRLNKYCAFVFTRDFETQYTYINNIRKHGSGWGDGSLESWIFFLLVVMYSASADFISGMFFLFHICIPFRRRISFVFLIIIVQNTRVGDDSTTDSHHSRSSAYRSKRYLTTMTTTMPMTFSSDFSPSSHIINRRTIITTLLSFARTAQSILRMCVLVFIYYGIRYSINSYIYT